VKAFLKAGILGEDGVERDTSTGTPQGGILSPLLANIALTALDDHFAEAWAGFDHTSSSRQWRRLKGLASYRLVRYADDFVVLVAGRRAHVEALRDEVAAVLRPMGCGSETKTKIADIDEGFDFLGFRIKRHEKRGTGQRLIYTNPSKAALADVKGAVRTLTQGALNRPLSNLLYQLNPLLRGWTNYFRHGVSKATLGYLRAFVWRRVVNWLRHKHRKRNWNWLRRHHLPGWWLTDGEVRLFNTGAVPVTRRSSPLASTPVGNVRCLVWMSGRVKTGPSGLRSSAAWSVVA
jgi:RNA-directed DNA polymerase